MLEAEKARASLPTMQPPEMPTDPPLDLAAAVAKLSVATKKYDQLRLALETATTNEKEGKRLLDEAQELVDQQIDAARLLGPAGSRWATTQRNVPPGAPSPKLERPKPLEDVSFVPAGVTAREILAAAAIEGLDEGSTLKERKA